MDADCRDIAYSNSRDLDPRYEADKTLENRAWEQVKAADSSKKTKAVACMVTNAMKAERKMRMDCETRTKYIKKKIKIGKIL